MLPLHQRGLLLKTGFEPVNPRSGLPNGGCTQAVRPLRHLNRLSATAYHVFGSQTLATQGATYTCTPAGVTRQDQLGRDD